MPRTVPKMVARAGRAASKSTTNRIARFMESHSPERDRSHGMQAAAGLISEGEGDGGASGSRGNEARGRRERFDGTKEIQGFREFDRRLGRQRRCGCHGWGQHEGDRSKQRAVRIMTAR